MGKRLTVRPDEIGPGFYVAFGCDQALGGVFFFMVTNHPGQGLVVWGLSRYRGSIDYRTLGLNLKDWLGRQKPGVQYRRDFNRRDWPTEVRDGR